MRLTPLCQFVLRYEQRLDDPRPLVPVAPWAGGAGRGYAEGRGQAVGERLSGALYWSNRPVVRSDNVVVSDFHGLIRTDSGDDVLFSMGGYAVPVEGEPHAVRVARDGLFTVTFLAEAPGLAWLNRAFAVAESYSADGEVRTTVWQCENEVGPRARSERGSGPCGSS